jgi:hypothetical protein
MDQCLRLLKAKCVYCHFLRLPAVEVHRYICMLRLINYGLIKEAAEVKDVKAPKKGLETMADESDGSDDSDGITENIMAARDRFVKLAIKKAAKLEAHAAGNSEKTEAVSEFRKTTVKSFLQDILKPRVCSRCKG